MKTPKYVWNGKELTEADREIIMSALRIKAEKSKEIAESYLTRGDLKEVFESEYQKAHDLAKELEKQG